MTDNKQSRRGFLGRVAALFTAPVVAKLPASEPNPFAEAYVSDFKTKAEPPSPKPVGRVVWAKYTDLGTAVAVGGDKSRFSVCQDMYHWRLAGSDEVYKAVVEIDEALLALLGNDLMIRLKEAAAHVPADALTFIMKNQLTVGYSMQRHEWTGLREI